MPTWPVEAAVVSEPIVAPGKTPCRQSNASKTRGATRARRPPKRIAEMGTPCGSSNRGEMAGHCRAGVVNREFGWAAFDRLPRVQCFPCQSIASIGAGSSAPSHQGVRSGLSATFVKIVFRPIVATMLGLVFELVPGATAKKPASGLTAYSRPSFPKCIQAMSSPTVQTFQPLWEEGGTSIARLVLPQALGKAAAM